LHRLRDQGFLEQHGQRGGSTYTLARTLRPPAGLRLSPGELADLVLDLATAGPISNSDVRAATGLDRSEALAILDRLVKVGRLTRTGERRGAKYHRA
jgi:ATP-dependent DNA helicase RecG